MKIDTKLEIPDDIVQGLLDGDYYRDGGIIRNSDGGTIVKLLKEADTDSDDIDWRPIIGLGVAVTASFLGYLGFKRYQNKKIRKNLQDFDSNFKAYIQYIQKGQIKIDYIVNLEQSIDDIISNRKLKKEKIAKEYSELITYIYTYTFEFLKEHSETIELSRINNENLIDNVKDLKKYICIQKELIGQKSSMNQTEYQELHKF